MKNMKDALVENRGFQRTLTAKDFENSEQFKAWKERANVIRKMCYGLSVIKVIKLCYEGSGSVHFHC